MIGIFISVWVFLVSWALPGQGLVEALNLAGAFLFYWTAFWSLLLFGLVSFFLAVGGAA